MATLALGVLGSTVGGAVLPSIGGLTGAAIGQAAGALAGRFIDQALFAPSGQTRQHEGPRLKDVNVSSASEGAPIPKIYGRARLGGQLIWATPFEEEIITRTQSTGSASGGKGGASGGSSNTTKTIEYRYYANFAIGLSEGEVTRLGRVWANGNPLKLSDFNYRFYKGDDAQNPDSLIESREGAGNAPAYKGLCYIVFERMPLAEFGNRIPQLNFELFRRLDDFETTIPAITLIPSAGEYVYENEELIKDLGNSVSEPENTHTHQDGSDWDVSLDQLQTDLPNVQHVSLFVSWFGDDLRVGNCALRPRVDNRDKVIIGREWLVSNSGRQTAPLTSTHESRPAYGGTPSDETIISALTDLKARGLKATFHPFILMDIPEGNTLDDPWSNSPAQQPYPWRGRITVNPAPGQPGTVDKTSTAASQLQAFIGSANPADFSVSAGVVTYTGPAEWSLRRMLLHYAHLCAAAGGVDSFLIASELRALTTIRDETGAYPFVAALKSIAADIKTILGSSTKVTYAADWSEYFGHQPADGSGDVFFHLDPLWSDANIDAIGIDCYWPLSDWRSGSTHLDASLSNDIYQLSYLKSNIRGGEGYDWYYASEEDRISQTRTPITDGFGKPWIYRYKDIENWWKHPHYNRPAGIEEATPTAWQPESKPFWCTELGCPAITFASNQPNLFLDPKSSESNLPHHSDGGRDDYIQRQFLSAFIDYFSPSSAEFIEANNPQSSQYSGRMIDPERIYVYTWDARPYPAFPGSTEVWGDGENWLRGHWLTGRTGSVSLTVLVKSILADYGFTAYQSPALNGIIDGYVIDNIMPARDALQPLELAFFFDSYESGGLIHFKRRGQGDRVSLSQEELVEQSPEKGLYELTRAQESELPRAAKITYIDGDNGYQSRTAESQQNIGQTRRIAAADLPIILEPSAVESLAGKWIQESWAAREEASFTLPPSKLALEPTDIISVELANSSKHLRITEINNEGHLALKARSIDTSLYQESFKDAALPETSLPAIYGPTKGIFIDAPIHNGSETQPAGFFAATQQPWPGTVALYVSPEQSGFTLNETVTAPARLTELIESLATGPTGRWDHGSQISITLPSGELSSISEAAALSGGNRCALQHDDGSWEVLSFTTANLVGDMTYLLSGLLRGLNGTEASLNSPASSGANFIMLDEAIARLEMTVNDIGRPYYWRYGPAIHSIGHPSYQTDEFSFEAHNLRPYSPVHIKAAMSGGDLIINWIRRSRTGGDLWEREEIPLGETSELYDLEILNGSAVIRTATITAPTFIYTAADQIADWGSPEASYQMRLYQRSEYYGRGAPATATIFTN